MNELLNLMAQSKSTVALTGAGISTLCGIPDFRGPQGLFKQPGAERIFDIEWFRQDPTIYYQGCRTLVYELDHYEPGPVHRALAQMEQAGFLKAVITQNIDMLHQKAGTQKLIELHGSPLEHHCFECGHTATFDSICRMLTHDVVARCKLCGGAYKPDITFFGEMLSEAALNDAAELAEQADLMLVLGSSLTVYPAASLPLLTLQAGGNIVIVNAQPTQLDRSATVCFTDLAEFAAITARLLMEK